MKGRLPVHGFGHTTSTYDYVWAAREGPAYTALTSHVPLSGNERGVGGRPLLCTAVSAACITCMHDLHMAHMAFGPVA